MTVAKDCETTGVDLYHGAKAFFFSGCDESGEVVFWETDVDPLSRDVRWSREDLDEIEGYFNSHDRWVYQNSKYDITAERASGVNHPEDCWDRIYDTLIAAHLLGSNQPKDLTSLCLQWLGVDLKPLENRLGKAVQEARRIVQQSRLRRKRTAKKAETIPTLDDDWLDGVGDEWADWRIADEGLPEMPSAGAGTWRFDYWLPRAMAQARVWTEPDDECRHRWEEWTCVACGGHAWWTVLRDYACADSAATAALWPLMRAEIERRGLGKIYEARLRSMELAWQIEANGVTVSGARLEELRTKYRAESERLAGICVGVAQRLGHELTLPKGARNKSLDAFVWDVLKLPKIYDPKGKAAGPTIDSKLAIPKYLEILPLGSDGHAFIRALADRRAVNTAITYLDGYERFWQPTGHRDFWALHPGVNPTGPDTLRWSHSNPNSANISKKESFNLRHAFGPAPGREWWSVDFQNLELRIPAFEAGEEELVHVFTHPDDPPYFGSYHLVVFDALHPAEFKQHGKKCKQLYESTFYQWVKNGNFAVIYGAQKATADKTYHVDGAYELLKKRFPKIAALNDKMIRFAEKHGWVETIPDRTVDPEHGYPLLCSRSEWGRVLPTVPLNYHVSGTARWIAIRAMDRCHTQLKEWGRRGFDGRMALEVHDELVFDFPKAGDPREDVGKGIMVKRASNLWRVRKLQALMASCGTDVGVPTPVAAEYHPNTWSEGHSI